MKPKETAMTMSVFIMVKYKDTHMTGDKEQQPITQKKGENQMKANSGGKLTVEAGGFGDSFRRKHQLAKCHLWVSSWGTSGAEWDGSGGLLVSSHSSWKGTESGFPFSW